MLDTPDTKPAGDIEQFDAEAVNKAGTRQPLYAAMARNWGVRVAAADIARIQSAAEFETLVAKALEARG